MDKTVETKLEPVSVSLNWIRPKSCLCTTCSSSWLHHVLQSNRHHQQPNIQIFTGRMPFLSPNQQCQSTEGNSDSGWWNLQRLLLSAVVIGVIDDDAIQVKHVLMMMMMMMWVQVWVWQCLRAPSDRTSMSTWPCLETTRIGRSWQVPLIYLYLQWKQTS